MLGIVVFTLRTSISIHQPVIEILVLLGASQTYIVRQFLPAPASFSRFMSKAYEKRNVGVLLPKYSNVAKKADVAGRAIGPATAKVLVLENFLKL